MKSKRGWTATSRLKTNQLFGSLFPRSEVMVSAIANHMKVKGYDESQPIIVWDRTEEEGKNALYIVDGHTRKCAAVEAGISPVYTARVKFDSEKEALEYAIHNQRDRRNMTDADLLRCIQAVDSRKSCGGDRKSEAAKSKTSGEVIDLEKSPDGIYTQSSPKNTIVTCPECHNLYNANSWDTAKSGKCPYCLQKPQPTELSAAHHRKASQASAQAKKYRETSELERTATVIRQAARLLERIVEGDIGPVSENKNEDEYQNADIA